MSQPTDQVMSDVALLNAHSGELASRLGIEIVSATPERIVATMPVEGNRQPYMLLHGGASVVLAETIGSALAVLATGYAKTAVGAEINASHLASAKSGQVTASATVLSLGSTMARLAIEVHDEDGKLICSSRLTCGLRDRRPSSTDAQPR